MAADWGKAMSDYKHPLGGNISEHGPMVTTPAFGVVAIIADDNSTIDMTTEQARRVAARLSYYADFFDYINAQSGANV